MKLALGLIPQPDSDVKAKCADTVAIAQGILWLAWIQISIKLSIKCLGVELIETIDVAT